MCAKARAGASTARLGRPRRTQGDLLLCTGAKLVEGLGRRSSEHAGKVRNAYNNTGETACVLDFAAWPR